MINIHSITDSSYSDVLCYNALCDISEQTGIKLFISHFESKELAIEKATHFLNWLDSNMTALNNYIAKKIWPKLEMEPKKIKSNDVVYHCELYDISIIGEEDDIELRYNTSENEFVVFISSELKIEAWDLM